MNKNSQFLKVIRDCVHGNIVFNKKIFIDLIDCIEFQRLHKISQLGGTFIAFPTAKHTRFSHSLGTYFVTREIINNIKNMSLTEYEKDVVMISALLHDLGHGPFSHAFELMYPYDHEGYSVKIITDKTEINQVLNAYHPNIVADIAAVINKKHPNKVMVQLVSSQLDADRLDYLKRDSFFTGVSYSNMDLFWLIKNMEIVDHQIVFNYKAVINIEQYLLARYNMFNSVYLYPTCNAYELTIKNIVDRLKFLYKEKYQFKTDIRTIIGLIKEDPLLTTDQYLKLNDHQMLSLIAQFEYEDDTILARLSKMLSSRKLLKLVSKKEYQNFLANCNAKKIAGEFFSAAFSNNVFAYKSFGIKSSQSIIIKTENNNLELLEDYSKTAKVIQSLQKTKTTYYICKEILNDKSN